MSGKGKGCRRPMVHLITIGNLPLVLVITGILSGLMLTWLNIRRKL